MEPHAEAQPLGVLADALRAAGAGGPAVCAARVRYGGAPCGRVAMLRADVIHVPGGAYLLGVAIAAVGEAVRAEPPSAGFTRAGRYFGRTLGIFGVAFLAAVAFGMVGGIIFTGGFGVRIQAGALGPAAVIAATQPSYGS